MFIHKSVENHDPDQIRDPFTLIEKGNELESSQDLWAAAYHFLRASTILRAQSKQILADESSDVGMHSTRTIAAEKQKNRKAIVVTLIFSIKGSLKCYSVKFEEQAECSAFIRQGG